MPCAIVCRNAFRGLGGIYKQASLDYARVRRKNVEACSWHAPALLFIAHSWDVPDAWRFSGDTAGVSFGSTHFFASATGDDSRGAASGGCLGKTARLPIANCQPGLEFCVFYSVHLVFFPRKISYITSHLEQTLSRPCFLS